MIRASMPSALLSLKTSTSSPSGVLPNGLWLTLASFGCGCVDVWVRADARLHPNVVSNPATIQTISLEEDISLLLVMLDHGAPSPPRCGRVLWTGAPCCVSLSDRCPSLPLGVLYAASLYY